MRVCCAVRRAGCRCGLGVQPLCGRPPSACCRGARWIAGAAVDAPLLLRRRRPRPSTAGSSPVATSALLVPPAHPNPSTVPTHRAQIQFVVTMQVLVKSTPRRTWRAGSAQSLPRAGGGRPFAGNCIATRCIAHEQPGSTDAVAQGFRRLWRPCPRQAWQSNDPAQGNGRGRRWPVDPPTSRVRRSGRWL